MISVVAFLAAAAFAMPSLQLQQTQSAIRAILPTFIETSPMPTDFILWETKKSTVRVCSRTDSIYTLASQSFAPNPLVKGKDVNVQSTGVFSRVIEDGAKVRKTTNKGRRQNQVRIPRHNPPRRNF